MKTVKISADVRICRPFRNHYIPPFKPRQLTALKSNYYFQSSILPRNVEKARLTLVFGCFFQVHFSHFTLNTLKALTFP